MVDQRGDGGPVTPVQGAERDGRVGISKRTHAQIVPEVPGGPPRASGARAGGLPRVRAASARVRDFRSKETGVPAKYSGEAGPDEVSEERVGVPAKYRRSEAGENFVG
ncbi:hypothetical protein GCM10011492_21630 [Flexivirga endophytica]|uniref:Uncharacterized protein n=1 Tax=Flexivirga endophytica TaxID=1849103 RepID=A0A916WUF9_9MICO|nr:hypothetical protein GCM10011492_21630 [Flexivirga endophytica]GHB51724.1 hypothetical protein GCM10008112_20900 [Flexivirga endophytica]